MQALILTGRTLSGMDEQATWVKAAALFKFELDAFRTRVLARCPAMIKETADAAEAHRLRSKLFEIGAETELVESDGSKWQIDDGGSARGPVPLGYLSVALANRRLAGDTRVKRASDATWITLHSAVAGDTATSFNLPILAEAILQGSLPEDSGLNAPLPHGLIDDFAADVPPAFTSAPRVNPAPPPVYAMPAMSAPPPLPPPMHSAMGATSTANASGTDAMSLVVHNLGVLKKVISKNTAYLGVLIGFAVFAFSLFLSWTNVPAGMMAKDGGQSSGWSELAVLALLPLGFALYPVFFNRSVGLKNLLINIVIAFALLGYNNVIHRSTWQNAYGNMGSAMGAGFWIGLLSMFAISVCGIAWALHSADTNETT